jgi:hypothetical protein
MFPMFFHAMGAAMSEEKKQVSYHIVLYHTGTMLDKGMLIVYNERSISSWNKTWYNSLKYVVVVVIIVKCK